MKNKPEKIDRILGRKSDFTDGSWPKPGEVSPDIAAQVTLGRSWYRVRKDGAAWMLEEHRVGEHGNEVREHRCTSAGEVNRLRTRLAAEGLVGYGEAY